MKTVSNDLHVLQICTKYEKHFPKMQRDVGMAVLKPTQTRYMAGSVQTMRGVGGLRK